MRSPHSGQVPRCLAGKARAISSSVMVVSTRERGIRIPPVMLPAVPPPRPIPAILAERKACVNACNVISLSHALRMVCREILQRARHDFRPMKQRGALLAVLVFVLVGCAVPKSVPSPVSPQIRIVPQVHIEICPPYCGK